MAIKFTLVCVSINIYNLNVGAFFIVFVQVIDKSMPVFNKQFYSDSVPENIELHSPLSVAIQAESPLGRKLIYTIVKGNELEEFAVDFNTGKIFVCFLFLSSLFCRIG